MTKFLSETVALSTANDVPALPYCETIDDIGSDLDSDMDSEIQAPYFVLIHGWGVHGGVWRDLVQALRARARISVIDLPGFGRSADCYSDYDITELMKMLLQVLPDKAIYVGWSLGGNIACHIAQHFPERVQGLITLASNPCFVASRDWDCAMEAEVFTQFEQMFLRKPAATLKRFTALQANGKNTLRPLRALLDAAAPPHPPTALAALNLLASLDVRQSLASLRMPVSCLFADEDALVPQNAVDAVMALGTIDVQRVEQADHAFLLSHITYLADFLLTFAKRLGGVVSFNIDKQQVAASFSRAALTYDGAAQLQRRVGHRLMDFLPQGCAPQSVLDLGSGTGYFSGQLAQTFDSASVFGLDIATGMLQFAKDRFSGSDINWLAGDAEKLPLRDASIDLVFSSLAIQWCADINTLLQEVSRVLRPGGSCLIATLGPQTLHELRDAWSEVDDFVHVNRFHSAIDLEAQVEAVSALKPVHSMAQSIVLEYDQLQQLTQELKALGAHNLNSGRPKGLTGKSRVVAFKQAYEKRRNNAGKLPASYQVIYSVLQKNVATS